jgi:ParB-like nuclease domain
MPATFHQGPLLTTEIRTCYPGGVIESPPLEIQIWPIDRLVLYARNPRKNDAAVDRMCSSIREFGFKIPVLARSDGEVVDGHLRLRAARKLGITEVPVILCDEWTPQQVRAFRLMVNRSVTWAPIGMRSCFRWSCRS